MMYNQAKTLHRSLQRRSTSQTREQFFLQSPPQSLRSIWPFFTEPPAASRPAGDHGATTFHNRPPPAPLDLARPRRHRGYVRRHRLLPRGSGRARPLRLQRQLHRPPTQPPPRALRPVPAPPLPPLSLSAAIPVHVRLAGASFPASSSRSLPSLISAAVSSAPFLSNRRPHRLALSHTLHLDVVGPVAAGKLASRASAAVRAHLDSAPAPFHKNQLSAVPYALVDDIVAEDYRALTSAQGGTDSASAVYIYVLDLGPQPRSYAYTAAASGADSSSPGFSRCLGPIWTGKERYIWIDLGAGPVNLGPAQSGDGVLPRGESHSLSTLHGRPKSEKALLADVASLILSAYKSLLVPSLRIPVHYEDSLLIRFVHIHGNEKDSAGLDFNSIEQSIRDGNLPYEGQSLKFESHAVKYSECSICSFAIARSTYSFTSRFFFENYTLLVNEYLDSKRLRQVLSDSSHEMHRVAGVRDNDEYDKVVPVFVFDLDYDRHLLLDRHHQAVAFGDMVIAVRTRSSQTKDAARRNVLLTSLNYTISSAIDVLESMATHGGENILLRKKRHIEFIQRWNLLTYKLEKVVSAMSRLDYEKAMYLLRSSHHDLYAIHSLVYQASQELEASLFDSTQEVALLNAMVCNWTVATLFQPDEFACMRYAREVMLPLAICALQVNRAIGNERQL
ncbi:hypothetical protein PR202_gb29937 [Eleusine coracana subsp. coracana]|uniref:DUF7906 domain-containing protein n=1 Tax=Eleusine coracana subsp. coracana TaxID=191504 RepID=A0AAV5FYA2_ELECO|nr:hypothetical protein PR202_gb29937 [Eleusine coracana subsp. coracana]